MPNTNCLEGVRCPACSSEYRFRISCMVDCIVTDDGAVTADDNHWDWRDDSACSCCNCGHHAPFRSFKIPVLNAEKNLAEYERYFDECERANKKPMAFMEWSQKEEKSNG